MTNANCFSLVLLAIFAAKIIAEEPSLNSFYESSKVQIVHLTISDEAQKRMLDALPKRIYVPAEFRWNDIVLKNVGMRFKGNSSSQPQQGHKRSFLVRFDKFESDQRFLGMQRVSFDNGVQFGSVMSEPIMTEILRDIGLPCHRANHARVFLNDKFRGVYVNVERIDDTFLAREFSSSGPLFKVDEGGPGSNLQFLGENLSAYAKAFEPKNESARQDLSKKKLVDWIRSLNSQPAADHQLSDHLAMDDFLRVTAVMLFSGAFDQLTGWNAHNYYLFYDEKEEQWRYLPWDLDVGFCETAFGRIQVIEDWNAAWPVAPSQPNPLLERIVADPALLRRYREVAAEILEKYFEPERLTKVLETKYQLVKQDLATDPFPHRRVTNPDDRSYDDIVDSMKRFIRKRYATAKSQLANPGLRPKRKPQNPGAAMPPQLQMKIKRIQQTMRRKEEEMRSIHRVMQKVGPLVQQQKFDEAEKLLDRAQELAEQR